MPDPLRILFISDWRIQPLDWIERILREHGPVDVIAYGGDDVSRFAAVVDRPPDFGFRYAKACGFKVKDKLDLFSVDWARVDRQKAVAAAEQVLERSASYAPLADAIPMYPQRALRLFRSPTGDNTFSILGSATRFGVGAVIGNDCFPEERYVLDAPYVHNLHAAPIALAGWGFVGIEGSIVSRRADGKVVNAIGYVLHDDREIGAHIDGGIAALGVDATRVVLVSHTPPRGVLDIGLRFGIDHLGSPSVARFIRRCQPALVLCGHCHSCGGRSMTLGRTTVINAASDDRNARDCRIALIELSPPQVPKVTWLDPATKNSLLTVPNIGPVREARLVQLGITTPGQLFDASHSTLRTAKFGEIGISKIRGFGQALAAGQPVWLAGDRLDLPEDLLFYDVETGLGTRPAGWDPLLPPPPAEPWLIGVWVPGQPRPKQWFVPEDKRASRRALFDEFLTYVRAHPDRTLCSWSGNRFDERAIATGLKHWYPSGLKEWESLRKIDLLLFPNLRRRLILPSREWSVQRVASTLGLPKAPNNGLSGFDVGLAYERFRAFGERLPIRAIRAYNAGDVLALGWIAKWLAANDPGTALPPAGIAGVL